MKKWIILAMLAVTLALTASVASADHSWNGYHWARTANPFTLKLVDSVVDNPWDGHLISASADWTADGTALDVLDTQVVSGAEDSNSRKKCAAISGKVRVCDAEYGFNGWLGLATIRVSGIHIVQGTAKLNDSYLNNPKFITPYETPAWRQFVLCQEVGHPFGLGHQDEVFDNPNLGSCMDYTDDPDGTIKTQPSNLHPNQHDYDQLVTIYGSHTDGINTYSQATGLAAPMSGNHDDEDFGAPTGKKDGKGRDILFVKEEGGMRKFTWVLWADWNPSNAN